MNAQVNFNPIRVFTEAEVRQLEETLIQSLSSNETPTKHDQLIYAVARIIYRNFNDGDSMYLGYGCETCGSQAAWLIGEYPEYFKPAIEYGLSRMPHDNTPEYFNLLGTLASTAYLILQNEEDGPATKNIFDCDPLWETSLCNGCEIYYPVEELESDGCGNSYCGCCVDHEDY